MTQDFLSQVRDLMDQTLSNDLSIAEFCAKYETLWNFERDETSLTAGQAEVLKDLFETAAWHSEVEEDLSANPRFKTSSQVRAHIERARRQL